jgi:hypothetical protein
MLKLIKGLSLLAATSSTLILVAAGPAQATCGPQDLSAAIAARVTAMRQAAKREGETSNFERLLDPAYLVRKDFAEGDRMLASYDRALGYLHEITPSGMRPFLTDWLNTCKVPAADQQDVFTGVQRGFSANNNDEADVLATKIRAQVGTVYAILRGNPSAWTIEGSKLVFTQEAVMKRYSTEYDKLPPMYATLQALSTKR